MGTRTLRHEAAQAIPHEAIAVLREQPQEASSRAGSMATIWALHSTWVVCKLQGCCVQGRVSCPVGVILGEHLREVSSLARHFEHHLGLVYVRQKFLCECALCLAASQSMRSRCHRLAPTRDQAAATQQPFTRGWCHLQALLGCREAAPVRALMACMSSCLAEHVF